jgi:tRNA-Thr(GGU) m(6)t(6)A37 methyltransferase TsaA
MSINLKQIGTIHTPYQETAPFRPDSELKGDYRIEVFHEYKDCLCRLDEFSHIIVLFHIDRSKPHKLKVVSPFSDGQEIGLFASRSPNRPNPIGMSIVKLNKIEGNIINTSGLDILDKTPLLDIKPYIPEIDCHPDANNGWQDK